MYVLGIETSCDETAAAVVKDGRNILSNVISSSAKFHKKYGGIVPEIASRMQLETITQVADYSVKEAGIKPKDLDLISVTKSPGLLGSLLVGVSFAKSVSFGLGVPLLGVDHVYAHIYASFLSQRHISLPVIALIVSGGHTSLFYVEDFDKIKLLGETQDDACGEAFDKAAKILGLGYPGGPIIERLARRGGYRKIKFRCCGTDKPLNFSFSGIKTAVLYYVRRLKGLPVYRLAGQAADRQTHRPADSPTGRLSDRQTADIAASFQEAVFDSLITKTLAACRAKKINRVVVGGGVAMNARLRERIFKETKAHKIEAYFPSRDLCMDNAAMVAGLGYRLFKKGYRFGLDLNAGG